MKSLHSESGKSNTTPFLQTNNSTQQQSKIKILKKTHNQIQHAVTPNERKRKKEREISFHLKKKKVLNFTHETTLEKLSNAINEQINSGIAFRIRLNYREI